MGWRYTSAFNVQISQLLLSRQSTIDIPFSHQTAGVDRSFSNFCALKYYFSQTCYNLWYNRFNNPLSSVVDPDLLASTAFLDRIETGRQNTRTSTGLSINHLPNFHIKTLFPIPGVESNHVQNEVLFTCSQSFRAMGSPRHRVSLWPMVSCTSASL
jgi:hypothetical protein